MCLPTKRSCSRKNKWIISVPHWDELAVKNLWKDLKDDASFNVYFQDSYQDQKGPNRKYFFDILNTIYPDYLNQIMTHASKQRYTEEGVDVKIHTIKATEAWYNELKNLPFKSCKSDYFL